MADQLKETFDCNVELIESDGGVYEVQMGSRLIFSKKNLGRFPEEGEIIELVERANE